VKQLLDPRADVRHLQWYRIRLLLELALARALPTAIQRPCARDDHQPLHWIAARGIVTLGI